MKKKIQSTISVTLAAALLTLLSGALLPYPWWAFIIPLVLLGAALKWWQLRFYYFLPGFLAGFIVWAGANFFYDATLHGTVFLRMGQLLGTPPFVVPLLAGLAGGLLGGLALYTGSAFVAIREEEPVL
ncbi:MAG TPA: hypothetical protein VM802_17575 [Chitinophaga sp.]|uniref:hypothetical protein n=1 Tax=Chitinophaga sp. TaxID=1869181 RepID=UPI002C28B67B|nr:hypothetical protein [Chitinophaga sp.]HVI46693.1 hypothetical protein [Chitinophaga sp.]